MTVWESWLSAGILLGLFSLVSHITVFEKRPMGYYKSPIKFAESAPVKKTVKGPGGKKNKTQRKA